MSPEHLDNIIHESAEDFRELLGELHPRIREAASAILEESQDTESGKATVKVSIGLSIDLTKSPPTWQMEAAVGIRHKIKGDVHDSDPTPELPGMGSAARLVKAARDNGMSVSVELKGKPAEGGEK